MVRSATRRSLRPRPSRRVRGRVSHSGPYERREGEKTAGLTGGMMLLKSCPRQHMILSAVSTEAAARERELGGISHRRVFGSFGRPGFTRLPDEVVAVPGMLSAWFHEVSMRSLWASRGESGIGCPNVPAWFDPSASSRGKVFMARSVRARLHQGGSARAVTARLLGENSRLSATYRKACSWTQFLTTVDHGGYSSAWAWSGWRGSSPRAAAVRRAPPRRRLRRQRRLRRRRPPHPRLRHHRPPSPPG